MSRTYRERVLDALTGRLTPAKPGELAKELNYHPSTVAQALRDLVADGKISQTKQGFSIRPKVRFL